MKHEKTEDMETIKQLINELKQADPCLTFNPNITEEHEKLGCIVQSFKIDSFKAEIARYIQQEVIKPGISELIAQHKDDSVVANNLISYDFAEKAAKDLQKKLVLTPGTLFNQMHMGKLHLAQSNPSLVSDSGKNSLMENS